MVEIVGAVVCTRRIVKKKEHLPFCKDLSILFIKDRIVADCFV